MDIVDPQGANDPNLAKQPDPSADTEVPKMDLERTLPRQISTGNVRGTQTVTGEQLVSDPTTNNPVITTSGINQNQLFSDPKTNIGQVLLGNLGDGTYGMKVAQPGVEVSTATNSQLIFNSNQNVFKIAQTGTIILEKAAGEIFSSVEAKHNLGITPMCIAAVDYGDQTFYTIPAIFINDTTGAIVELISYITTSESVYFNVRAPSDGGVNLIAQAFTIRYYLLQETAN